MAFCKYCGSQIEDGQECTCEGAQAAKAAAAAPQPQVQQAQPQAQPQVVVSTQPTQATVIANNVGPQMGSLIKKFFTAPLAGVEEAYASKTVAAQFIYGGIYIVLSLLCFSLALKDFVSALEITALVLGVKLILAVVSFITKTVEGGFLNTLAAFSYTTLTSSLFTIIISLVFGLKGYLLGLSLVIAWIVVGAVHTAYVFHVMHRGSENKGAIIYLITVGVVTTIAALIFFKITGISDAFESVMGLMSDLEDYMDMYDDYMSMW